MKTADNAAKSEEKPANRRKVSWKKNPEAVQEDILSVATEEFATHGLAGANVNEIARNTSTSKRMIYYYFGDKEGLYQAVLERVYQTLRKFENTIDLSNVSPVEALRRIVLATFEAHASDPKFIRLVMIENIHNADYLRRSVEIPKLNQSIIKKLEEVCDRGKASGDFRDKVDPLELHWMISSFSFYNVSNRETFSTSFGRTLYSKKRQAEMKRKLADMVLAAAVHDYEPKSWN